MRAIDETGGDELLSKVDMVASPERGLRLGL